MHFVTADSLLGPFFRFLMARSRFTQGGTDSLAGISIGVDGITPMSGVGGLS